MVGAVVLLVLEGAVLAGLLCGQIGDTITRLQSYQDWEPSSKHEGTRAQGRHTTRVCVLVPFFSSSTIWTWRWHVLQFPFLLPVPQAWHWTQSRMLSQMAWKPWAGAQGTIRRPATGQASHPEAGWGDLSSHLPRRHPEPHSPDPEAGGVWAGWRC